MFGFSRTNTVKKSRQEISGVDRNRFAEHVFKVDRYARRNSDQTENLFVIAQTFINRERSRMPVAENALSIL
jgi:hypothetical protein